MKRLAAFLLLCLAPASAFPDVRGGTRNVQAELVASTDAIQPGVPFMVALSLRISPGWRVFWKNPGETGVPVKLVFTLPDSFKTSEVMWPSPEFLRQGELATFGYTGEATFLVRVTPPASLPNGLFSVLAQVQWVESGIRTTPWSGSFTLALPVGKGGGARDPLKEKFFADAVAKVAKADPSVRARYVVKGASLEMTVSRAGGFGEPVEFFPVDVGFVEVRQPGKVTPSANGVVIRFQRPSDAPRGGEFKGVLVMGTGPNRKGIEVTATAADVKAH